MRIKKLLIAGALMLTAVGCVSAYTIYADTLNNNTDNRFLQQQKVSQLRNYKEHNRAEK